MPRPVFSNFVIGLIVSATALVGFSAALAEPARRTTYDFLGVVARVDHDTHSLIVRTGKSAGYQRHTVRYDDRTEVVKSRKPFAAKDIRPDMRIWVYLRAGEKSGKSEFARRLTISDPYPDITGTITAVDAEKRTLVVLRRFPGSGGPRERRQPVTVRVNDKTEIRVDGEEAAFDDIPIGRNVSVTSVRDEKYKPTDLAAKVSVRKPPTRKPKEGAADESDDAAEE